MRAAWDTVWMEVAVAISKRSTCIRRSVGAIIVRDNKIVSSGFNGAPSGQHHCLDIGCLRNDLSIPSGEKQEICRAVHAEQNALLQAGLDKTKGATLYTTLFPCNVCAKSIVNSGVGKIVYLDEYVDKAALELIQNAGITVKKHILPE